MTTEKKNPQVSTGDGQGRVPLPEDSQGLGSIRGGQFQIGFVDEVNGPGAVECVGYRPTHHELR